MLQGKTLHDLVETYTGEYAQTRDLRPESIVNNKGTLHRLLEYLAESELNRESCQAYLTYLRSVRKLRPTSMRSEIGRIRAFTAWLTKRKHMEENFGQELEGPIICREDKDLPSQEIAMKIIISGTTPGSADTKLSRLVKRETQLALQFMLLHGTRITETLSLKGSDFNLFSDPPSYRIFGKGGHTDLMPIVSSFIPLLGDRITKDKIFGTKEETCRAALKRGCKNLNIPIIGNHDLRRIFATTLARNKTPETMLKKAMRHTKLSSTYQYYVNANINDIADILNANQPLARGSMDNQAWIKTIKAAIASTGVEKHKKVSWVTSEKEIVLKIKLDESTE